MGVGNTCQACVPVPKGEEQRPATSPNTEKSEKQGVAPHGIDTVDDGSKGWTTDQHREQSTSDHFAKCPKDQSTDDKGVNSTTHAQPMYHLMPNNVPNSDYRPMLNAQVAMTGLGNMHSEAVAQKQVNPEPPKAVTATDDIYDMRIQLSRYTSDDMYPVQTLHTESHTPPLQEQLSNQSNQSYHSVHSHSDGGMLQINEICYETPPLPGDQLAHEDIQYSQYTLTVAPSTDNTDVHTAKPKSPKDVTSSVKRLSHIMQESHGVADFDTMREDIRQRYECESNESHSVSDSEDENSNDSRSESKSLSNESGNTEGSDLNRILDSKLNERRMSQCDALERERDSVKEALRNLGAQLSSNLKEADESKSESISDLDAGDSALRDMECNVLALKSGDSTHTKSKQRRASLVTTESLHKWTNKELATEQQEMVAQIASLAMRHSNDLRHPSDR